MTHQGRFFRFSITLIATAIFLCSLHAGFAEDNWFERMAVPMVSGDSFVAVRDGSLKGVGLYPMNEIMLGPWYVLGTWPRDGSSSIALRNVDVATTVATDSGALVWKAVEGWDDPSRPLDLAPLFEKTENVSAYLYRSLQSPGRASVELRASADDDFTVWLNGKEVIGRTEDGGGATAGKHRRRVVFEPGENELIVRVGQATGAWLQYLELEPQIDPKIRAKILHEALRAFPDAPESYESRVELAQLLVDLNLAGRALEQANRVLGAQGAPPGEKAKAQALIDRFVALSLTTSQAWNLFTPDELTSKTLPFELRLANNTGSTLTGQIDLQVHDIWGREAGRISAVSYSLPPDKGLSRGLSFEPPGRGAYLVEAETRYGKAPLRQEVVVGLLPKAHPGLRPESFFAATTRGDADVAATARIGVKVVRDFFCNPSGVLKSVPPRSRQPFELDFGRLDKAVALRRKHGLSILPIVGYVDDDLLKSSLARRHKTSGPPRDYTEYTSMTVPIVSHLKDVKYWDFWGDPWVYGPTWSASAASFRYFYREWKRKASAVRPDAKILVGGRPAFYVDNISHDPNLVKTLDGLTNATRHDPLAPHWRSGAQRRSMDFAVRKSREAGANLVFVTDSETAVSRNRSGLDEAHRTDAAKLVKFHVLAALCGNFQANVGQDKGWGRDFAAGNVAYSVMTHWLEDRPIVADVWPVHPLLTGAVFANPRWVTDEVKGLPRADVLSVRWDVPVPENRRNDATKVAVIWSETGVGARRLDQRGRLTIRPAGDIRALDMVGRPIGEKKGDALTVPFNPDPVYLLSNALGVVEMRRRIAGAEIEGITPVNSYPYSLPSPLGAAPTTLTLRVQNQMNRPIKGALTPTGPPDWKIEPARRTVELQPAELAEFDFRVTAEKVSPRNQYILKTEFETDAGVYENRQVLGVACIHKKTIMVDGEIDDWTTGSFTHVDIEQQRNPERFLAWLADPSRPRDIDRSRAFVGVDVAAAYDEEHFYIAAVVHEPGLGNDTDGRPGSYGGNPLTNGDCLEFVWGFSERARDESRTPGDPWYWKGVFRDADYSVIQFRNRGDQPILLSLCVPGLPWRTDFQTERNNTFAVPRAQTRFVRNEPERTTTYEIAIRRRYLNRFDPSRAYCRFGYVYFNDEKLPPLEWSRACGVFDYWANFGSYLPAWQAFLPCQTRWGIAR